MRVFVFTAFFITMLAFAPFANAAEVSIRTGTHAEYSRLVFDWKEPVTYTKEKQAGAYTIKFSKAASLNTSKAVANPVANISGLKILSEDPLSVSINIPENSRIRDLKVGNKIIVDVFNPPGGKKKVESFEVDTPPAVPVKTVEKLPPEEELKDPVEDKQPETPQIKASEGLTTIAISSTQSFGMAVFERK